MSQFIDLVRSLDDRRLCVKYGCTTCGCRDLRQLLAVVPNLADELAEMQPDELRSASQAWGPCLYWAISRLATGADFDTVLNAWTPKLKDNIWFADHVLFYSLRMSSRPSSQDFLNECIRLAEVSTNLSLVETIAWRLGARLCEYPNLLQLSLRVGGYSACVYKALAAGGFVPNNGQIAEEKQRQAKHEREAKAATRNIFSAIRRNDCKAVASLLKKQPDLTATNEEGMLAIDFAMKHGNQRIIEMLCFARDNS